MKRYLTFAFFLCVGSFCLSAAIARPVAQKSPERRIVPVLVRVNSHGKVTDASPAYDMRASFNRVLKSTLDKMISKPAMDHGHPVASQFVINLAMDLVPQGKDRYGVKFSYVSSKPLPSGQWVWVHRPHARLALQDVSSIGQQIDVPREPCCGPPRQPPPSSGNAGGQSGGGSGGH